MAGLYLYRSNIIENLSKFLSANLLVNPLEDPLAKEYVVIGSRGMEQWVKRRLSEDLGIVSNIEFPFPTAHLVQAL
jgi:exodeoxyribonuclease V gamma subunit